MESFKNSIKELIQKTSTILPMDVADTISASLNNEEPDSIAHQNLNDILENCKIAKEKNQPICQDTGLIVFFAKLPKGFDHFTFKAAAAEAVAECTEEGLLRQNSIDPLTGKNSGNNLGNGSPIFYIEQWDNKNIELKLILKGGGCENVSAQYSLPDFNLKAERNIDGIQKCILDSVNQAQGKGCAPGILGVCIGGTRASGYHHALEQFLRLLNDTNENPELAKLETYIFKKANQSGIGPMGLSGNTTLLGCKIGALNRTPASYFVTISYMCWAFRRHGLILNIDGNIVNWIY